jgi:hypothetical protein
MTDTGGFKIHAQNEAGIKTQAGCVFLFFVKKTAAAAFARSRLIFRRISQQCPSVVSP